MKLRPRALLPCVLFACLGGALRAQQAPPPDAPRRDLRRAVEAVRDSSALIGYIIGTPRTVDEALAVAAQAKAVADADSRHPGIVALPDTADADLRRRLFEAAATRAFLITPRFLGAGDAPGDLALGPANEGLLLLEYVSSCCEMAGKAPVWAALDVAGDGEGWRSASVEEIRLATWVSLAGGAKGVLLGPYSALVDEHLKALDSRAPEIRQLGGAVRELTAALLDIAPTDAFAEGPEGIILRCFMDHQGRPILIVVNTNVAAPARPVIELDATALGHPWEAQDIVSRLALPARGEGDVRRIAPPSPCRRRRGADCPHRQVAQVVCASAGPAIRGHYPIWRLVHARLGARLGGPGVALSPCL